MKSLTMPAGAVVQPEHAAHALTPALTILLAICAGTSVANLYYAQPLLHLIGGGLGDFPRVGWIPVATQLGYTLGILMIVPLGDLLDRRRLTACLAALASVVFIFTVARIGQDRMRSLLALPEARRTSLIDMAMVLESNRPPANDLSGSLCHGSLLEDSKVLPVEQRRAGARVVFTAVLMRQSDGAPHQEETEAGTASNSAHP